MVTPPLSCVDVICETVDVYFKLMAPYNWDPRTTANPPFENFSELWKPSTLKKVKNLTMQVREELLATQVAVDAASVIDTNGHVDKTVKTDAQRVLGSKKLAVLLGVDKLTCENGFQLLEQLKSQIEAQHPNASAEANAINGDFLPFYSMTVGLGCSAFEACSLPPIL